MGSPSPGTNGTFARIPDLPFDAIEDQRARGTAPAAGGFLELAIEQHGKSITPGGRSVPRKKHIKQTLTTNWVRSAKRAAGLRRGFFLDAEIAGGEL
jgi:hypothetical protein